MTEEELPFSMFRRQFRFWSEMWGPDGKKGETWYCEAHDKTGEWKHYRAFAGSREAIEWTLHKTYLSM